MLLIVAIVTYDMCSSIIKIDVCSVAALFLPFLKNDKIPIRN